MPDLQADHPSVAKVMSVLDNVGLKYSGTIMSAICLEGGVDILKAGRVKCFAEKVTDQNGGINPKIFQAGVLPGRRALLAHVVETLVNEHGAKLNKHELPRDSVMDEAYEINVDGTVMSLWLMPR